MQLSGGENLIEEEKREIFDEDIFSQPIENESYEDEEGLELSLRQKTPLSEKSDEAEGLLKLATTACEAGKIEEAKAGLESYFNLLHELGKIPTKNVLHLSEKLEISFETSSVQAPSNEKDELIDSMMNYIKLKESDNNLSDNQFISEKIIIEPVDYYYSNVIARSSQTMSECRNEKLKIKPTGTYG